jgi:heme/copper-type cytochrome/quinol oxidase subunit 2
VNPYFLVTAVTAFFALFVVISVVISGIKYRDRTGARVRAPIKASIGRELGWSIVPFLTSMTIFGWTTAVLFDLVAAPDQTLEIYSAGTPGVWRLQHINGQTEVNERKGYPTWLRGEDTSLSMTRRGDQVAARPDAAQADAAAAPAAQGGPR